MVPDWFTTMSDAELATVKAIAERDGCSMESAANRLASEWLARTVKRKTGRAPARVYGLPRARQRDEAR